MVVQGLSHHNGWVSIPPNLLVVQSGPNSHVDCNWMEPSLARFIRRLASFSRLILYDNRGVGLSDPRSDNIPAMRAARVNRTEWLQG